MTTSVSSQSDADLGDVQARLMRMLEAVRLDKEAPGADEPDQPEGCPNCHSLTPWGSSSWCPDCGYYPKLGRAMTPVEIEVNEASEDAATDFSVPAWTLWLAGGLVLITAGSIAVTRLLSEDMHGGWGRLQLVMGVAVLAVAQARAYLIAARKTDAVPLSAFFFEPFQLWQAVCRQLPSTRWTLYLGSWGFMTSLLAVCVIGLDLNSLFSQLPQRKARFNPMQAIMQMAAAAQGNALSAGGSEEDLAGMGDALSSAGGLAAGPGSGTGSLESSIEALAGGAGAMALQNEPGGLQALVEEASSSAKIPLSPDGEQRVERGDFLVFGYLTNAAGEMRSILLAEIKNGRGRFVSKLPVDEIAPPEREQLQQSLDRFRAANPALPVPYQARWVLPVVQCEVAYVGWTPDGRLRDGYLIRFSEPETPSSEPSQTAAIR